MSEAFNWHSEPEGWRKNLLINVVPQDKETFEQLSAATEKFTNVTVTMHVNGIEVDVDKFLDRIQSQFDWSVEARAKELVREVVRFDELQQTISDVEHAVKRDCYDKLRKLGVEIHEDDWYGR